MKIGNSFRMITKIGIALIALAGCKSGYEVRHSNIRINGAAITRFDSIGLLPPNWHSIEISSISPDQISLVDTHAHPNNTQSNALTEAEADRYFTSGQVDIGVLPAAQAQDGHWPTTENLLQRVYCVTTPVDGRTLIEYPHDPHPNFNILPVDIQPCPDPER